MAALRTEAGSEARKGVAARTGEQFLAGLAGGEREIWLNGEKITHPLEHRELEAAARSMARVFDVQHEHAEEMLAASPDDGRLVNVTHLIPRSKEDLERRRRAIELTASFSGGTMGRTPDYLNVTFACFAGRSDVWARRGNEQGAENLVAYQRHMRDADLSTTHALINPQVDRSKPEAEQAAGEISLHKIGETENSIVVRGGRMLATLAPFADDLLIYPGSDIRPQDGRYALSFAVPIATPGLKFICRDSYSKQRPAYDYPLSSRFDEMDCVVIFDDVEVPRDRVFIDGNKEVYSGVMLPTAWWANIMQQTTIRALTKLEFAYGLASLMAEAVNDTTPHTLEMLGELHGYVEITRSAVLLAEEHAYDRGEGVWFPDGRPLHPMRAQLAVWFPRVNEILIAIGSHNLLATPSRAMLDDGRLRPLIEEFLHGANGVDAERRAALYRLAWDFVGSNLGSRNDLYERNYLASARTNRIGAYMIYSDRTRPHALVDAILGAARSEG